MSPRSLRFSVVVGLALVTWALLAVFVELQRERVDQARGLTFGGVAFAAYVLTIGYAIYYRAYWAKPRRDGGRKPLGPLARWTLTIALLGGFGITVGVAFPDITRTYAGELFVQTVTFGGVGLGLILSVSGRGSSAPRASPETEAAPPPSFVLSALKIVGFQVGAVAAAVVLFGPAYLVMRELQDHIDKPACQASCASHGYAFEDLVVGKSVYNCICHGNDGRHVFHDRAYVGGGHGFAGGFVDWLVRFVLVITAALGWPALLFFAGTFVWSRWLSATRRSFRPR